MQEYNKNKRYCPREIAAKQYSVETYRQTRDISYVCRKYKISKASLMLWNKKYDGTKASSVKKITKGHPGSLYNEQQLYQYTMIDEATGERFIYAYSEQSSYSTIDFVKRAIKYFGYIPQIIQTDNGTEFAHFVRTDRVHPLDVLCKVLNIVHKLIRPRTPRHNGKVERSHRNDQELFYNHLKFYSFEDLQKQMAAYLRKSNNIPMSVLNWRTPLQKRQEIQSASNARFLRSLRS